jgi:hypothetical protein
MKNMEETQDEWWKDMENTEDYSEKLWKLLKYQLVEEEEEEVSLGVIMTYTEIFHIFHIISLFNLLFFHIFHIISHFIHIFHIISQFSSVLIE